MLSEFFIRFRALFSRERVEAELDEEIRFHQAQQIYRYMQSGLSAAEAAARARASFGGSEQIKEECRDERGVNIMENFLKDLRYGLRVLRKAPAFTITAVLTLGLGIGANAAIFSILYNVLLRPLPYRDGDRVIVLNETTPRVGMVSVSVPNYFDWRSQNHSFSQMAFAHGVGYNLSGVDQPESIGGQAVTANFLSTLGARPIRGRDFDPAEEKPGAAPVVMLSYSLWQARFGGESGAVGRTINLDGKGFTIIGVLPADFRWTEKTDLLIPLGIWATNNNAFMERGDRGDSSVTARLAPGVSLEQARSEMNGIAARLEKAYPNANDQFGVALRPVRDVFVSGIRPAILVLFTAVMFVLLIACANVANLILMRGAGRVKEVALRMAIGAKRSRIIAQMLAESLLLTSLGGIIGVVLAFATIRGIGVLLPANIFGGATVGLNGPVFLFAMALVAFSGFLFGFAPALHLTRVDLQSQMKESSRASSSGAQSSRWRDVLVVAEVSLALVLLVGAGLMMKSLYRLLAVDPGVRSAHVLNMDIDLRTAQYEKDPAILNFWDQTLNGVRSLPGVEAAALGDNIPLSGDHSRNDITIENMPTPKPGSFPHPDVHVITPGYVETLGVRLLSGRSFNELDNEKAPRTAMINARLAHQYFPSTDPVGKRFRFGGPGGTETQNWMTIVGVVGDTKLYGLENPSRLEVYVPLRQNVSGGMTLLVKSAVNPRPLIAEIRRVVASIDKGQPVSNVTSMDQLVKDSVSTRRITLVALATFSALALLLAGIGIYGVISYSVAERRHEIGIRIALGASPGDILRLLAKQSAILTGTGILIGVAASIVLTRLMSNLLFSVSSTDPGTFAAVTIGLVIIAMLASYIPARRSLRIDPAQTLRCE